MAVRTISTKLAVDGEAQFKKSISDCNRELKTLSSSLALTEREYQGNANSLAALSAKHDALEKILTTQRAKVEELQKAFENAKAHQEAYTAAAEDAKAKGDAYRAELEELKKTTGDTSKEQAELAAKIAECDNAQAEAEAAAKASTRAAQDWERQLNSAKIEERNLSDAVKENEKYIDEAKASTDGYAKSIDNMGNKTKDTSDGIEALASALAAAGVAKTVQEIAAALMECADAAGGFETAMAKVSTLADSSVVPLETMKNQLLELSGETGVAVGSLAEATYQALSAGVDTANAVEFVSTATKLSVAGFTESATAVDVLTTAINAYGLAGSDAEAVASKLVKTQDLGKTSVGELAASMGRVIPTASAYNVSLDNLTAAYAVLTKSGTSTRIATTNLSAMFDELAKEGSGVADVLLEYTGKSFAELMASGSSLSDIIDILSESVNGDSTAFSNLWSSSTAGKAALTLFNSGAEEFTATLDAMANSSGSVERNFQIMADTTEFSQQRMENAANNLKIAIGDQLTPALNDLYSTGADAFTWATEFVNENPWVVSAVVGLTAAIGALTVGLVALKYGEAAVNALHAALLLLEANPIVLVATAVIGLTVALGVWIAHLDDADAATKEYISTLKDAKAAYDDFTDSMKAQQKNTAATAAALKELLAVEEKSAAQKAAIAEMVESLNEAVPDLGLAYGAAKDEINMTTEALDALIQRAADQETYNAQVSRLSELYTEQAETAERLKEAQAAYHEGMEREEGNIYTLENNYKNLKKAYDDITAELEELQEATKEYGEWQAASEKATKDMTATVSGLISEMEALQGQYNESYNAARQSIEGQIGLFSEMDGSAKTSIDNLISTLTGQVSYMETYAENIQKAMELGVDQGLVQKLSDGSQESAQILAAIVEGGEDKIDELNEQFAKVQKGKDDFARTVAEMETDFSAKMDDLETRLGETVDNLNVSIEAGAAGAATIQGYIDGAESMRSSLISKYKDLADAANKSYKKALDIHSPSKVFREDGQNSIKGAILGGEDERADLEKTYGDLAESAGDAFAEPLSESYQQAKDAAKKSVDSQVSLFKDLKNEEAVAVSDMISSLKGQAAYMETYAADIKKAMELGVDHGLIEKLSDGSEKSAKILSEIVKSGKEGVEELNAQLARVEEGKDAFASTMAELQTTTSTATEGMKKSVDGLISEMGELEKAYESAYNAAYKSIDGQLGLTSKVSGTISTTGNISELIFNLDEQARYLEGYNALINMALDRGVNKEIVSQLADGSEKSAQELLKIVAGSDTQIDALNKNFERVKEGKEKFSGTVAEMETDFGEKMKSLEEKLSAAVDALDASLEASDAGAATIQGYIDGAESKRPSLIAKYTELAKAANAAYAAAIQTQAPVQAAASASAVSSAATSTPSAAKAEKPTSAASSLLGAIVDTAKKLGDTATGKKTGDTYVTINSPERMDEKTAAREFKKSQRDLSLEIK